MTRTVKQDLDLLIDIKQQVIERLNIDYTQQAEIDEMKHWIDLIFENQNKWLLSDKISSEKQQRMDMFRNQTKTNDNPVVDDAPTPKQIAWCQKNKVNYLGLSKKQVSDAIDKKIKENVLQ